MDHIGTWYNWPYDQKITGNIQLLLEQFEFLEFYSENHSRKGNGWSGGGPFSSKKRFTRFSPSERIIIHPSDKLMYDGKLVANAPSHPVFVEPDFDVEAFGPELYRRAKPAKPLMDLGNAIYELKDLPGMVKQGYEAIRNLPNKPPVRLKDVSNFNLAVAFGWLPLLGDTIGLYQAQRKFAETLEQLLRDNGRPVRRKFNSDSNSSTSETKLQNGTDPYGTLLRPGFLTNTYGDGDWELSHHATTKVSFAGQFRYWLPPRDPKDDNRWKRDMVGRLFGLYPSPSRIYKAMPWSWLIDWFGNVGDNIANLNTDVADRLINDYAFVMRHMESFNRLTVRQRIKTGGASSETKLLTAVTESGTSYKERAPASPFGFRLKIPDLSPYQATILGSLKGKGMRF